MRRALLAATLLTPGLAWAQSSPNFQPNQVLTAQALNAALANKADVSHGTLNNPTITNYTFNTLVLPGGTATGFGWAPGNILPPFENFNSTGHPGWHATDRLIFQRTTPTAADFADLQLNRTTTFTGGNANTQLNAAFRITTTIGASDTSAEYGLISQTINGGTGSGLGYGAFIISQKSAGATAITTGTNISARDFNTSGPSSTTGGGVVGLELSTGGSQADDAGNAQAFGNRGIRVAAHIVGVANASDTSQAEYAHGLWFGINDTNNSGSANGNWDSIIGFSLNTQVRAGLDMRGAIVPTGSTDPLASVIMQPGHILEFNGSASLISNPGSRYLTYSTGSTALQYLNAGAVKFAIDDSGDATAAGFVASTQYQIGGVQVVGARNTGWTAMTGAGNKNTVYDVATVTLPQLASRVAILQSVLTSHGLIGP